MEEDFNSYESVVSYVKKGKYIYIIYSEYGFKIGFSRNPIERLDQIKQGLPSQNAFIVGLYYGDKGHKLEGQLHNKYKKQNISGEWFFLHESDMDYIHKYLLENDMRCFIRISILWANFVLPSIFIQGKIQIIEKFKERKTAQNRKFFDIPELFNKHIRKPEVSNESNTNDLFFTSTEISNFLKTKNIILNPETVGAILNRLGFEKISKHISGIGSRRGYRALLID